MSALLGCLLVPTSKNPEMGVWFIFHHESEGILAFDITRDHPDIPYRIFAPLIDGANAKDPHDQTVLLGGPMQSDSAMLILHNNPLPDPASHRINADFSFLSYRLTIIPGKPPIVAKADDTPSRIDTGDAHDSLIVVGFRLWDMEQFERELHDWQWTLLPATPDIVYRTPTQDRLSKARLSIN